MKYFFTTKVKIALILAVLLAAGLAIIGNLTGKTPGDMLVQGVLTPLRTGVSSLTDRAEQFYNYMFRYEALEAENAALREELAKLREDSVKTDALEREIQRLKELLGLKQNEESFQLVDSYIISWSSNDWSKSFTVNRGSAHGIQEGMCAITESKAVVGLVTEVGTNYAVIKSVLDSSLEISAALVSSGHLGIVQGGYATDLDGMLRMDYIPSSAIIRNRDQVVTAGSTVYPRNLLLGYVVDADFDETGVAKFAILEPAVDIDSLEQVFILTDFTLE